MVMGSNPINYLIIFLSSNAAILSRIETPAFLNNIRYKINASLGLSKYILKKYQFLRFRIKIFSFDLVKTYVHFKNSTITPGIILSAFNYPNARNLRKNLLTNHLYFKFFQQLIWANIYVTIRPLCLRNDWFILRFFSKLFIFVHICWRGRVIRHKRIKKWVKKKYIRRNNLFFTK